MTSGRYHIDLPGDGAPRDVQLSDVVCADLPGALGTLQTDDPTKGVLKAAAPASCRALR